MSTSFNVSPFTPDTFFQQVLECTPIPISAVDLSGNVLFASKHHAKFKGCETLSVLGASEIHLYPQPLYVDLHKNIYPKLLQGEQVQWDVVVQHVDDVNYRYRLTHALCCDLVSQKEIVFTVGLDITETYLVERVLSEFRGHAHRTRFLDPLTGLANRSLFYDRIHRSLSRVKRGNGHLALMLLDLDNFGELNEAFGHDAGDVFLKKCAQGIVNVLRDADSVARMSGDKFVIVLETIDRVTDVESIAEKLLETVSKPLVINDCSLSTSASIGVSLYPKHGLTVDALLKQADAAMYRAKADGRNSFCFYNDTLIGTYSNTVLLENELQRALANNELCLYYQPQVSLVDKKITGLEALIRWQHPERGLLSPAHFVPLAEESGLIEPIGLWIVREASERFRAWLNKGIDFGTIAVNLSVRQIRAEDFVERIVGIVNDVKLDTKYIELEITESTSMGNAAEIISALSKLNALGFSLSIDDFGTGYSSLSYLEKFPISKVKIDRCFLSDIDSIDYDAAIAKSIISLGRNLSLNVLAEGVERLVQSKWLEKNGCHFAQGYFYSKPLSGHELSKLAGDAIKSKKVGASIYLR